MNLAELILHSSLPVRELTESESEQLKQTLLEIYKDVLYACQKHGLTVMLGGGSCLGAVRHNGFIPWDDDLDVMMMRADYDRLPEVMRQEYGDKYTYMGPNISDHTNTPFIKLGKRGTIFTTIYDQPDAQHEIAIDVFPIENIPDNRLLRLWHGFWLNLLQYIALCICLYKGRNCYATQVLRASKEGRKKINKRLHIGHVSSWIFDYSRLYAFCDRLAAKYAKRETKDVTIPTGRGHYFGEIHPREDFLPAVKHVFADIQAPLPHNYDAYLRKLYGNYMQLPPINKREKHSCIELKF